MSARMIASVHFNLLKFHHRGSDVAFCRYPIVFAVTTLPLSVVRWTSGFGSIRHKFSTATFVVESIYSLSGAVNVLLFLSTRPDILLPGPRLGRAPGATEGVYTLPEADETYGAVRLNGMAMEMGRLEPAVIM